MTTLDILAEFFIDAVPSVKDLGLIYNPKSGRFTDPATGRFLSQNKALSLINEGIEQRSNNLQKLAEGLSQGKLDLDKFLVLAANNVKQLQIYNTAIAKNGRLDLLTKNELAALNKRVKEQLTSTKGFEGEKYGLLELAKDILKGEVSEAQLKNRLSMYVSSAEQTQEIINLETKKEQGYKFAMRRLGATHKNCPDCVNYAAQGWVSIKDVILPGERCQCRSNCKCSLYYR